MNAVRFDGVSKRFILRHERPRSLQELFLNALRLKTGPGKEEYWALRDVSFRVAQGEMIGIVGPNGAGKSTVLKLISRIIEPTSGQVEAKGRIGALLELGAGFHDDLTGRENIYLNGSILGLTKGELTRIFDDIVGFAQMESFVDVPVKQYSSGMFMRLGFSVAVHLRPEILLVDEVLAVGDRSFRFRCLDKIREMKRQGVTIVFVTHDLNQVRETCDRAIWLNGGLLQADGTVGRVLDAYRTHVLDADRRASLDASARTETGSPETYKEAPWRWGTRDAEISHVQMLDDRDQEECSFQTGGPLTVRMHYVAHEEIVRPQFGLAIFDADGFQINGPNTTVADFDIPLIEGLGYVDYVVEYLPLLPGSYLLSVGLFDSSGQVTFDYHHQAYSFRVNPGPIVGEEYGSVLIPSHWRLGRTNAKPAASKEQD
jgi:ABC-type polysaccharide/polyol phosphate transport system ATPase subunit